MRNPSTLQSQALLDQILRKYGHWNTESEPGRHRDGIAPWIVHCASEAPPFLGSLRAICYSHMLGMLDLNSKSVT